MIPLSPNRCSSDLELRCSTPPLPSPRLGSRQEVYGQNFWKVA